MRSWIWGQLGAGICRQILNACVTGLQLVGRVQLSAFDLRCVLLLPFFDPVAVVGAGDGAVVAVVVVAVVVVGYGRGSRLEAESINRRSMRHCVTGHVSRVAAH